jgi:hypothetical protein
MSEKKDDHGGSKMPPPGTIAALAVIVLGFIWGLGYVGASFIWDIGRAQANNPKVVIGIILIIGLVMLFLSGKGDDDHHK